MNAEGLLPLQLGSGKGGPIRVLCLGAHCDDIEIGCGGSILTIAREQPDVEIHWIVLSSNAARRAEATASATVFLKDVKQNKITIKEFCDGFFPYDGREIKQYFESLKELDPDLILTHQRADAHQDHRVINELTWNTFRNHLVLEYEILKYDGDLGQPNVYVPLDETICRKKVDYLRQSFPSQSTKHWYTDDAFLSLLRIRGIECRAPSGYAEAFYCRKMVLEL